MVLTLLSPVRKKKILCGGYGGVAGMAQLIPFEKKKAPHRGMSQRSVVLEDFVYNDYEPSIKEIEAYAAWLGMDLEADKDLLWIAKEGLKAPLPAPWKPCLTDGGNGYNLIYYFNLETGESHWDHPCTEHHKKVYVDEKAKTQKQSLSLGKETLLPPGWDSEVDPKSGCKYFFNRVTGETTWDQPQVKREPPEAEKTTFKAAKLQQMHEECRQEECRKAKVVQEGADKDPLWIVKARQKEEECWKAEKRGGKPKGESAASTPAFLGVPQYWISTDQGILSQGWAVHKVDTETLETLKHMFQVMQPGELGKGRDVHKYHRAYSDLEIHCAWRIEHPGLWGRFASERVMMTQQMKRAGPRYQEAVKTKLAKAATGLPGKVNEQVNETWLLHGSKPDVLLAILSNGLNDRVTSGRGGFGAGIYLAEDPEKADQYCVADPQYASPDLEDLHHRLYRPQGNKHPNEHLHYCFVVRTLLGAPLRTRGLEQTGWPEDKSASVPTRDCQTGQRLFSTDDRRQLVEMPGSVPPVNHHSLIAERGAAVKRFREFIAFDANQVYAEYLLAYKRV